MNRRKQELETNELADRLGHGLASVQPALPAILGTIAVAIVGALIWGVFSNSRQRAQAAAWTEYYYNISYGDPDSYLDVADQFPDSTMAGWARLSAADSYLQRGIDSLYTNRSEGEDNIGLAIENYEDILADAPSDELRRKALIGQGIAHESLGQLEKANELYEQFVASDAAAQLKSAVNQRIAFINSPSGKTFYQWFTALDPKLDSAISLPPDLSLPPTTPDLDFGGISLPDDSSTVDPSGLPELGTMPDLPPIEDSPPAEDTGIQQEGQPEFPPLPSESGESTTGSDAPAATDAPADDN